VATAAGHITVQIMPLVLARSHALRVTTKQSGGSTVIERTRSRRFSFLSRSEALPRNGSPIRLCLTPFFSFRGSASERVIRQALPDSFRSKEAEPNGYAVPRRLAMTRRGPWGNYWRSFLLTLVF